MLGRMGTCMVIMVLALFAFSCTQLEDQSYAIKGEKTAIEKLAHLDSIPPEWGNLVSVSSVPCHENWLQLWLQDGEGNIRMVPYNIISHQFNEQIRLIQRR